MPLVKPLTAAITSFADGRITEFFARHVSLMRSTSTSTPLRPSMTTQLALPYRSFSQSASHVRP